MQRPPATGNRPPGLPNGLAWQGRWGPAGRTARPEARIEPEAALSEIGNQQPSAPGADAVLLATGARPATGPFAQRVARLVGLWEADGRSDRWLAGGTAFFLLNCWSMTPGRPATPALRDYLAACRTAAGGGPGWDALLRHRINCPGCGVSWSLENIRACTGCSSYTCDDCQEADHRGEFCEVVG
ncbi:MULTISPECIES: hypothetical protein [Kitasatospora]|uniref:hypothetical protein n=1 Tax=Kitasatospora TaxID=2063 RepID=UPI0011D18865|nr:MULTISPECIES: hypothetical protein [Kitasatospora]